MKKTIVCLLLLAAFARCDFKMHARQEARSFLETNPALFQTDSLSELRSGDILFQSSRSGQSLAVQLATKSPYSHCGILFVENGEYYVYEAVQPVKKTLLKTWAAHGDNGNYVVKRLKDREKYLTETSLGKMKKQLQDMLGKNYDITFEWSDDRIYCSELVWKLYQRACGLEVGKLQQLGDFDLSAPEVKHILRERYGDNIPLKETVISPVSIFDSELLITVEKRKK